MGGITKNFVLTFIIMYFGEIAGDDTSGGVINLEYFQHPYFFDILRVGDKRGGSCEGLNKHEITVQSDTSLHSSCYGEINDCATLARNNGKELNFCWVPPSNDSLELVWVKGPTAEAVYGEETKCNGKNKEASNSGWTISSKPTTVCACTCYEATSLMSTDMGKWWFSTIPQTCDENKVITAVRFTQLNHTIYLQIKQHQYPFEGEGTWKDLDQEVEAEEGVHKSTKVLLTRKLRAILLDEIISPSDHVITGVQFEETVIPETSTPAIRLLARHTKLTKERDGLEPEGQRWDFGGVSKLKSSTLKWLPSFRGISAEKFAHVSFGIGSLQKDLGKSTAPTISADPTEILLGKEVPLTGIQLLLVNMSNTQQILPRVAPMGMEPSEDSQESDDDDDETYDPDGANTINLQFILIAIVPVLIISNLFD